MKKSGETDISVAPVLVKVKEEDRNLLSENGGFIVITKTWANSFLYKLVS